MSRVSLNAKVISRERSVIRLAILVVAAMGIVIAAPSADAARKALVIGNDSYGSIRPLRNATKDAQDIAATLRAAGFDVPEKWTVINGTRKRMDSALQDFVGNLTSEDEVVFYYSGHGVQINGQAALLPVDLSDPARRPMDGSLRAMEEVDEAKRQVLHESITFNRVAADIAGRGVRFSLLIADACRDNPVLELLRRAHQASPLKSVAPPPLAGIIADPNSDTQVFVFSASEGQTALDRLGDRDPVGNGVFTRVLLEKMRTPGLSLRDLLRDVKSEVTALAATYRIDGRPHVQRPVTLATYTAPDFYFLPASVRVRPASGFVDLEDLRRKQEWSSWQSRMQAQFDAVTALTDVKLQLEGWSRFLSGYTQDNPYSGEDEQLRREAGERMARAEASLTGGGVESRTGEMVRIELGCFMMGSPASELGRDKDERQHQVCIDEAFELGKYEVTIAEWAAEMGEITTNVCPNCAKLGVAWKDVMEFIGRLNARTGGGYRLPTEAEWEYAARAGTTTQYYTGDRINSSAANFGGSQYLASSDRRTIRWKDIPVGSFQANSWGLHDVLGNALEWTCSAYDKSYSGGEMRCESLGHGIDGVVRGGHMNSNPSELRSAARKRMPANFRHPHVGFRLARTLP